MREPIKLSGVIRPGDDFFGYVNNEWIKAHPIPDNKPAYGSFYILRDAATETAQRALEAAPKHDEPEGISILRRFYNSGMDETAIEASGLAPVQPLLDEIAGLTNTDDVVAFLGRMAGRGYSLLWDFDFDVDAKDSQRYLIRLQQGGLGLPDRDYYLDTTDKFKAVRQEYQTYVTDILAMINYPDPKAAAMAVYRLEHAIAEVSMPRADMRDPELVYNAYITSELATTLPGLDWKTYLETSKLGRVERINIDQPKFVKAVIELITSTPIEELRAYLAMNCVRPLLSKLPKRYVDRNFDFYGRVISGTTELDLRYRRVLGQAYDLLLEPIGQLYVENAFSEDAKAVILEMVAKILVAMGKRIDALDWMSEETKQQAHEKLATFVPLLGYPDTWRTYPKITLDGGYIEIWFSLIEMKWDEYLERANGPVNRTEWVMSPALVNACYWPNTNTITFPAAILQRPFFDAEDDPAANYGSIGAVIGHEITHGFDDEGSRYDAIGNLNSWWTERDRADFDHRADQLAAQYDAYEINGQHINGRLTLGENIADLGGALIAYDALHEHADEHPELAVDRNGQTIDQRFFTAYAQSWCGVVRPEIRTMLLVSDPHSPDFLRVNGVVTNLDAFYDVFDIKPGDRLYKAPEDRIRIW